MKKLGLLITSICLLLSMSKRIGNSLVVKILKFLKKIHLIKHYDKTFEKVNGVVSNYQNTMKTYAKNVAANVINMVKPALDKISSQLI